MRVVYTADDVVRASPHTPTRGMTRALTPTKNGVARYARLPCRPSGKRLRRTQKCLHPGWEPRRLEIPRTKQAEHAAGWAGCSERLKWREWLARWLGLRDVSHEVTKPRRRRGGLAPQGLPCACFLTYVRDISKGSACAGKTADLRRFQQIRGVLSRMSFYAFCDIGSCQFCVGDS